MEWLKKLDSIEELTQGSIVDGVDWGDGDNDPLSIVLSNACDLEHDGHCSYLIVAAMYQAGDIIRASREYNGIIQGADLADISKRQRIQIERLFLDYIHNRTINRYFFIDCSNIEQGLYLVVDFQRILSVKYEAKAYLTPVANLISPLREHMMMRFVGYTARIPIDRVSDDKGQEIIRSML